MISNIHAIFQDPIHLLTALCSEKKTTGAAGDLDTRGPRAGGGVMSAPGRSGATRSVQ